MRLYDFPRSGNCYKVRLFLALIDKPYETVPVALFEGGTETPEFLQLNPRGQIPVLEDKGEIIWDSMAILVYLARTYAESSWYPDDHIAQARVMQWLAVSENEILYGLARSRAIVRFNKPFNLEESQAMGRKALELLEQQLNDRKWLTGSNPTIADIACFPYAALAREGQLELDNYPAVLAWVERLKELPGFIPMEGIE
jgi:glutathione S-transferase